MPESKKSKKPKKKEKKDIAQKKKKIKEKKTIIKSKKTTKVKPAKKESEKKEKKEIKKKSTVAKKRKYFYAIGRRKSAIAQVYLYSGKGEIVVNRKPYKEYFPVYFLKKTIYEPLVLTGNKGKFDAVIKVRGGGKRGQAEAVRLGLSRALLLFDSGLKKTLREVGYLTRDSRIKERKKYGFRGARRGRQFRKR